MNTIAIIGAGPGLGTAIARRFGAEGHAVALIARSRSRLDELADGLAGTGITARGYTANVRDTTSLRAALDQATQDLGPIEVLTYNPLPQKEFLRPVLETTPEDLAGAVEFSVYAPVTAAHQVLQGMRFLGRGSILFVNGGSAVRPNPEYAGTSVAFAAQSAYGQMLHDTLAIDGIHVGQLIIPRGITPGDATHAPDILAGLLWDMHTQKGDFRRYADSLDA
ncbi:SDR family NAD(P)-dependent oxidoreductase [Microbacterium sp. DT81.1]|uniref:SDR family NAD(P)-dependent oxidoreductase n=1 Tax=Microbacterium sp. DT81.1 TaxID=3393413 RepID=UPI003CF2E460